jgi:hypothetical protein
VTAAEYAEDLDNNLRSLLERFKSGTYYAPPVRRVRIPKGDGSKTRPIGIPTFEDKVLQRAVLMVLEAVYEQDFYDFSYGFRPKRSAHQALDSLWHRLMEVLPKRFGKFGLALHSDKTRLIDYRRPRGSGTSGGGGKPPTFDFLGFTHYWGRSRKGHPIVKRKTARGRFARSLKRVALWCKRNRHKPIADQHQYLSAVLLGHYSYYGLTGNGRALGTFWHQLKRVWHYWLRRRSQRRCLNWNRFHRILKRFPLPPPKVVHSIYRRAANPCA